MQEYEILQGCQGHFSIRFIRLSTISVSTLSEAVHLIRTYDKDIESCWLYVCDICSFG